MTPAATLPIGQLNDIPDVSQDTPADGQALVWVVDAWTPTDILAGSGGSTSALDPTTIPWVAWMRADDIAGSDGAAITSFASSDSNARSFTGTGTLKTGANGISGHNVLRFNGSSDKFASSDGGASLAGDWYAAAVVKFSSLAGHQDVLSWGDSGVTGKRRSLHKYTPTIAWTFVGEFADVIPTTALANDTVYLLEAASVNGQIYLWVNGVTTGSGRTDSALIAYASEVLRIAQNPAGGEFFAGDMAEAAWHGAFSSTVQFGYRGYCATRYGISLPATPVVYSRFTAANAIGDATLSDLVNGTSLPAGPLVVGGVTPILTGGSAIESTFTIPATVSIYGGLAVEGIGCETHFKASYNQKNVVAVQNLSNTGYSAIRFLRYSGHEMAACGYANPNLGPFGGPNGSTYFEASNFVDSNSWGDWRFVQTRVSGPKLRQRVRDDTQAIEEYDLTATEPAVNGPTTGLVSLRGKPAASVANDGTLNTNITTGTTQCGMVVVKDATNSKCALYRLENTTLTPIGTLDAEFSTTLDNAGTVNIYNVSGQLVIQNKSGGALSLTAAYYGA